MHVDAYDAAGMAASIRPPAIVLPRLGWLPMVGSFLARVLPPKRHVGRVLSYEQFEPFRRAFLDAQIQDCRTCDRPHYKCSCEDDEADWEPRVDEEQFREVCRRFISAQGLPVRPMLALPGSVLSEAMKDFFELQTRANLPRLPESPTDGSASPGADSGARPGRRTA